jgi:hypothetical protein
MALLLFDGFDVYGTSATLVTPRWSRQTNGSLQTSSSFTRFGTGGCAVFDARYFEYDLASPTARLVQGAALWPSTSSPASQAGLLSFWDGATQQCTLTLETDGSLALRSGSRTGTVLAQSSAAAVTFSGTKTYQYIECDVTINNTTGAVQAWVEGVSVLNQTGLNTRTSANNQTTTLRLGDAVSAGYSIYCEDFYLLDTTGSAPLNAALGDVRVYTVAPNGAGTSTQWTPNSGANYQAVDDLAPDEDASYVASHTAGQVDLYAMTDLPASVTSVYAVGVVTRARKDDVGTRQVAGTVQSNLTDADGATRTLTGSYQTFWDKYELDPNGSAAWTVSAVNALKVGVKCIA